MTGKASNAVGFLVALVLIGCALSVILAITWALISRLV